MFCKKCGKELSKGAKFCPACGEKVVMPAQPSKDMSKNMCNNIMDSAAGFGADMLITACPLCLYNLNKSGNGKLPVYYFTELLAEALGVKDEVKKEVERQ